MAQRNMIGRRDFLRIVGVAGVGGLAAFALGREQTAQAVVVNEMRLLMGTVVNLALVTPDRAAGRAAIATCLDRMAGLEAIMSRHRDDSQLARLNRAGRLDAPSPHLVHVLREAQRIAALTEGAFDVTVKPLVDLYEQHRASGAGLPPAHAVEAVLERVGYGKLAVDDDRLAFARPGMALTLDGIAKGYIVDQGLATLRQRGFEHLLVEAGGDLAAAGTKPQRVPWQIGIRAPRGDEATPLHVFTITDRAVATSGDYMQPYSDDLSAHHILDPRAGRSASELASATLVAANGMQADALATAVMVLGPERGLDLVERLPACEAYLVAKDARIWQSSGFAG